MTDRSADDNGIRAALLAVDIGNTTVSLGCLVKEADEDEVLIRDRFPTAEGGNPEVIRRTLERLMKGVQERLADEEIIFTGIVISSVVPAVTETVRQTAMEFCRQGDASDHFEKGSGKEVNIPVVEITSKSLTGLIFRSIDMSTLGHDRIVDAAWAAAHVKLPAVTVDMGTATTFNVIDEGGIFLGGMICAGIRTGLWGLNQRTAALPIPKERQPNGLIGKKTVDCLLSGAYNGSAAMIDGLVSRVEEELGKPVTLVMTGGHAITVKDLCRHEVVYEPNLLMKGLALLFKKNAC